MPDDGPVIADFNSRMAEETEGRALDPELVGPGVMALLNDSTKGRYWLALHDGVVIGQIMITYEWSDWRNGMLWWIQSVYVDANFRRRGIYSALHHWVRSAAKADTEACGIRLYVERENLGAQATYRALGMTETDYRLFEEEF